MLKILEGDLASFEVPDLLALLGMGERTGALVLERPDRETKLFFCRGRAVYATSTAEELRLGALLVRFRKLSAEVLARLSARRPSGARLGQVLLSEKQLTEDQLMTFLKVQVSEVVFDSFAWRHGVFTFYDGVPPPAGAIQLEMDTENLIIEGLRRVDMTSRLAEVFPDRTLLVEALVNPERVKQSLTLTEEEWRVFFLVDGRRSLEEICRLAGSQEEGTLQTLHHLRAARLLRLLPAPAVPASLADEGAAAVQFAIPLPGPRPEDDTQKIVNPKAVQYMASATKLTVARLVLVAEGTERSFPLVRDSYTVGRHRNNDIVIADPKASAFHARIDRTPEGFALVDLKSRNGCWVNSHRVDRAPLKTGDHVRLGAAQLVYRVDFTAGA